MAMETKRHKRKQATDGKGVAGDEVSIESNGAHEATEPTMPADGHGNGHLPAVAAASTTDGHHLHPHQNGGMSHIPDPHYDALLHLLAEIGPELTPINDIDVLCNRATQIVGARLGISVSLWRVVPPIERDSPMQAERGDQHHLELSGHHNLDPAYHKVLTELSEASIRSPFGTEGADAWLKQALGTSPTSTTWLTRTPTLIPDIDVLPPTTAQGLDEAIAALKAAGVQTLYSLPLLSGKSNLGVLDLHYNEVHQFVAGEQELLQAVANQIGNSIEYSIFQEEAGRKTAEALMLREVGQMINSSLDLTATLDWIIRSVGRLVDYDAAEICLLEPNGDALSVRSITGNSIEGISTGQVYKVGEGLTGWIAQHRQPLLVGDVAASQIKPVTAEIAPGKVWQSFVGLPIIQNDELLGTLELVNMRVNAFSSDDLRLLTNVAEQAATAIENAKLHAETTRRNRELALLQEISSSINASLDVKATLRSILLSVQSILDYRAGEITLYDPERRVLVSQITNGADAVDSIQDEYGLDEDYYSSWLGRNLKPLMVRNWTERDAYGIAGGSKVRSYIGVPMIISGRLSGTIEISSDHENNYDEHDLDILGLVANQAAVAVENARLYESTDERLSRRLLELTILQRISQEINSTLDVEEIFSMVANEALKATGALIAAILEVDRPANVMRVRATAGDLSDADTRILQPFPIGEGIMTRVLEIGEPLLVYDVRDDPNYVQLSPRVRSEMIVPIRYEEEVVGLIDLSSDKPSGFDFEHLHFVEALAGQAATGIGVAQTYTEKVRQGERLAARANQLNQVLEIGNSLTPDRDIADVMDQVANAITDTLGYRFVIISLVEEVSNKIVMHRVASSGIPLAVFEEYRKVLSPMSETEEYIQERFRIGRSYFVSTENSGEIPDVNALVLMDETEPRDPNEWQVQDLLIVPMYSTNGELLGQISVDDPIDRQRPTLSSVQALEVFANQAASAVENARLFGSYRQRIFELDALSNIGRELAASLDLDAMCEAVYNQIRRIIRADAFHVGLQRDDQMITLLAIDKGERYSFPPVPLEGTLSHRVLKEGHTVLINSVTNEQGEREELSNGLSAGSGASPMSWLGVPLRVGEHIIGVLAIQHYGSDSYGKRDEQLLTTIANQLATAIQNARLFERNQQRVGELAMLNEVGSGLSAVRDEQELYEQAYSSVIKLLGAHGFSVALRGKGDEVKVVFHRHADHEGREQWSAGLHNSLPGAVIKNRRALLIGDLLDPNQWPLQVEPEPWPGDSVSRAWLGVPLIAGERVMGALIVEDKQPHAFTTEQTTLFTAFAIQFATALENADLFARNQQRISELAALTELGRELTASLDLSEIGSIARTRLQQLLPLDVFLLGFYDPATHQLEFGYVYNEGEVDSSSNIPLGNGPAAWVIKNHKPLLLDDVLDREHMPDGIGEPILLEGEGLVHSWMGAPLMEGGRAIGIVSVQYGDKGTYNHDQLQLLTTVANQLAIAVQNARSFAQNQQRINELALINEAAREITANLDVDQVCELLYQQSQRLFDNDTLAVGLYDAERQIIDLIYSRERSNPAGRDEHLTFPLGQGLSSQMITSRQPLLVRDAGDPNEIDPAIVGQRLGASKTQSAHAYLGVPLMRGDEVIGYINVQSYKIGAFREEQIPLLSTLASQAAVALQNAQLFQRNQQRITELGTLGELGHELTSQLEVKQICRTIYDNIKNSFPLDSFFVTIYDEANDIGVCPLMVEEGEIVGDDARFPMTGSLSSYVIKERKPLLIADLRDRAKLPPGNAPVQFGKATPCRSWVGVPMLIGNRVLGLIAVQSYTPDMYTANDVRFLSTVASQASVALENARLFEQYKQRIVELNSLNETAREITANLDIDQICELLYQQTQRLFDNDALFVGFFDEPNQQIEIIYSRERGAERDPALTLSAKTGITSRVVATRQPVLIKDIANPQEVDPALVNYVFGASTGKLTRSWLGVPLMSGGQLIGVLAIQSYAVGAFNEEQIPLLGTLAGQTVVALQNAQLFQRNQRRINELAALNDLGRELTSQQNVTQIGRTIYESIKNAFPLDAFYVMLYNEKQDVGFCPVWVDEDVVNDEGISFPLGQSLSGYMVHQRQPLMLGDVSDLAQLPAGVIPSTFGKGKSSHSWMGVPLTIGNRTLGLVVVQSYTPNLYTENDLQFLGTVASQASVAIENARLFEQYKQRISELNSLNEVTRAMTASMHVDAVAVSVYEHIKKFVDLDVFMLCIYDEENNITTWPFAIEGETRMEVAPQPLGQGFTSAVIEQQKPLIIDDVLDPPPDLQRYGQMRFGDDTHHVRAWAGVPMVVGHQVMGVISVQDYEPNHYDEDTIRTLLSVANQAAIAIQNAKLFEERERKIAELATINQMAKEIGSSLQIDELLQLIYNQVTQVMSTRNFLITIYEERRQEIQYRFVREHGRAVTRAPRKLGSGLMTQVIESRQPLLINYDTARYAAERGWEHVGEPARSWLGVPMTSGDQVLGVIVVQSYETENAYDRDDLSLLSTIASQAAVAIEKAKLFEETQSRVLQLDTLNEIGRILGAVLDEETVFQKIFEHTTRFFDDLSSFYIALYQRDQGIITFPFAVEDEQRIDTPPMVLGEGLTSYVIANRRGLRIEDMESMASEYEGYTSTHEGKVTGIRSWMGVPLFLGGEVIGLISLQSRKPNAYREEDLQFLSTLANQAAVAIKNAKLFDEIRQFNTNLNRIVAERTEALARANQELRSEKERITQLYEITHQLNPSLDLEDILNRGLRLVGQAVKAERGSIMTIDAQSGSLVYRAVLGEDDQRKISTALPWKPGEGAVGWVVANRTALMIPDVSNDNRWVKDDRIGAGIGSIISVPLMVGSDVYGVINLLHHEPNYFTESQMRLVSTVASEMAFSVHNADLYSYISEQAEALASSLIVQEQAASRSRAILESIVDGVLVFDSENRITLVNPAAETILGVSADLLLNRQVPYGLRNLDLGTDLLDLVQSVVDASRRGSSGALNLSRRRFSLANRIISVSLSPVTTIKHEVLGLVAVLRDITREVEVEREKSDFVSTVSHELRTPMTVIKGHTDLLLAGAVGALSPMQSNFLQAVKRNTDRMNALVSDLLTVSRIETGRMVMSMQPNYYDAGEIADNVVQTLHGLADAKNQQLTLTIGEGMPEVFVDRDRSVQVLTNLLTNAIKYTPRDGQIEVNLFPAADGNAVQVEVKDSGIGIAEADQEKLFTSFYRSDNPEAKVQEGTGLGLVIAKSLVELMGGQLWLTSKLGEGTTFSFTLPVYRERMETTSIETTEERHRGKTRILVVDDDAVVANGLADALEREGYETLVAYSGRRAVEIASQERVDLITMDIVMPEMDGFETMKALGDDPNSAGVPILIVSLVPEPEQGFALGAVGYLAKPADHDLLISSVERALRGEQHHDPIRVLVIDDEHDIVEGLTLALRQEGFEVDFAYSGEEGLHRVGESQPDIILLDMKMPGISGAEVLSTLKHAPETRHIPVIILTASEAGLDEARIRVMDLGAEELLRKPFVIGQIVDQIKKLLPEEEPSDG